MAIQTSHRTAILAGILLLAGVLRVLYLQELRSDPASFVPVQDAEYHDYWARGLATGQWTPPAGYAHPHIQTTPYFRPPGYAFFLAALYRITGCRTAVALALQMLLGIFNVWLAYLVARRWFGDIPALITAGLMASSWLLIAFEVELLDVTLHITTLLCFFWTMSHLSRSPRTFSCIGGLIHGLGALVRANTLLFLPFAAIWAAHATYRVSQSRTRAVQAGCLLVLGAVLAIAPVTLRNYLVADDFVLISANAGLMLHMGNSEDATGLTRTMGLNALQPGKYRSCFDYPDFVRNVSEESNIEAEYGAVSAHLVRTTWRDIRQSPSRFLKLTLRKALLFWGPAEIGHNKEMYYQRTMSSLLGRLPGSFSQAVALFLLGLALYPWRLAASRDDRDAPLRSDCSFLLLFILVYFISVVPFVFSSQYRVALVPFLFMIGGCGLYETGLHIVRKQYFRGIALVALLVLIHSGLAMTPAHATPSLTRWYYQRGYALERVNRRDDAQKAYEMLLLIDPQHAWAHGALGSLLARRGAIDEATRHFEKALEIEPDFPRAKVNLAHALYLKGRSVAGISLLMEVLQTDPDHLSALNGLAWIRATHEDPSIRSGRQALQAAKRACELTRFQSPLHLDTLAAAYAELGDFASAIETVDAALAIARQSGDSTLQDQLEYRRKLYTKERPYRMVLPPKR